MQAPDFRALDPIAKVQVIRRGDRVVTECAAICAYLADAIPEAKLAPPPAERAAYYRRLFFAAGPVETAMTTRALAVEVPQEKQGFVGYDSWERVLDALEHALAARLSSAAEASA